MSVALGWDELSPREWHGLLLRAPRCGLQQDWAYGDAVAEAGHRVMRAVLRRAGETVALVQLVERRVLGVARLAMAMRGPVWLSPEQRDALEPELLSRLRAGLGASVLLWTPERAEVGDRLCGLRRVMTGYSTVWLDLTPDLRALRARLHGKWRNMLSRAEEARLEVREQRQGPLVDWLLSAAERHRARVGFRGPAPGFVRRLAKAGPGAPGQFTLVAVERGEPVAGVVVQRHGTSATYFVASTTPRGRASRANHLLLWKAIALLRDRGAAALDLGGVDTVNAPGLARFKLGLGGTVTTLAGTFLGRPVTPLDRRERGRP